MEVVDKGRLFGDMHRAFGLNADLVAFHRGGTVVHGEPESALEIGFGFLTDNGIGGVKSLFAVDSVKHIGALCLNVNGVEAILHAPDREGSRAGDVPVVGSRSFGKFYTVAQCGVFADAHMVVGICVARDVLNAVYHAEPAAGIGGGEHFDFGRDGIVAETADIERAVLDVKGAAVAGKAPAVGFERIDRCIGKIRFEQDVFLFGSFLCDNVNVLLLAAGGGDKLRNTLCRGGVFRYRFAAQCPFDIGGGGGIAVKYDTVRRKIYLFAGVGCNAGVVFGDLRNVLAVNIRSKRKKHCRRDGKRKNDADKALHGVPP